MTILPLFLVPLSVLRYGIQISVTDDLQRAVTITGPAQRIVSLAPSITETLFAIGAGGEVVGVTDFCNYPEGAATKPRVGGLINPNLETIAGLQPDLILLSAEGNVREDFGKLESLGMPLFVTNPRSLQGIYKSIHDLGVLSGHLAEAKDLMRSLRARERAITARSELRPQHTVAFIVSLQPLMLVGNGTFLSELLDLAGAVNIARGAASTYPTYSKESVVVQDPDIIIVMGDLLAEPRELGGLFPEWKHIDAVRSGKVFLVDPDIVSRPGPRAVDGLEVIFRILYHKSQ